LAITRNLAIVTGRGLPYRSRSHDVCLAVAPCLTEPNWIMRQAMDQVRPCGNGLRKHINMIRGESTDKMVPSLHPLYRAVERRVLHPETWPPSGQRLFRPRSVSEADTDGGFPARRPNHRNLEKVGSCLMIRWRIRWEAEQKKGHDDAASSCSCIGGDLCCRVHSGLCAQLSFCLWARNWWLCAQI
jgi:hypothetical protein